MHPTANFVLSTSSHTIHSLPLGCFQVKSCLYLSWRYSVVHDEQSTWRQKKPNCFLLTIKADFQYLFWEKQSLFIMTFIINNFFQNSSGKVQHATFIMLSELAYISGKQSLLPKISLWDFFCSLYCFGTYLLLFEIVKEVELLNMDL